MSYSNFKAFTKEFPEFDLSTLPAEIVAFAEREEVEDQSWHNDVCPHLEVMGAFPLWIEELDPQKREYPELPRYVVASSSMGNPVTFETDNAVDAIKVAVQYMLIIETEANEQDRPLKDITDEIAEGDLVLDFAAAIKQAGV